ncbi:MAG: hypothetical protein V4493_09660 [Pseudomonadota bacterium]
MIGYGISNIRQVKLFAQAVCEILGGGDNAVRLLCETAAAETQCGTAVDRTPNGAGRGLFQCDKSPFTDTVTRAKQSDIDALKTAFGFDLREIDWATLNYSPLIAAAVCRLHYKLRPGSIPLDLKGRAEYWKKQYNSVLGAGTVGHYLESVARFEMYF